MDRVQYHPYSCQAALGGHGKHSLLIGRDCNVSEESRAAHEAVGMGPGCGSRDGVLSTWTWPLC